MIGIGTSTPAKLLTLRENDYLGWEYTAGSGTSFHTITGGGINPMAFSVSSFSADNPIFTFSGNSAIPLLTIKNGGNILIGKTSQSDSEKAFKLDVNGKVRANEIVVNTSGADFVFDSSYVLPSLQKVEEHIKENGYLPNVPSAEQMQKEGIGVSELQTILLQKVEELTLYIIEQNKKIEQLQEEISKMK